MSRSHRHSPFSAFNKNLSEAREKRIWHKKLRAAERTKMLMLVRDPDCWEEYFSTLPIEVSDEWSMLKEDHHFSKKLAYLTWLKNGKARLKNNDPEWFWLYLKHYFK